MPERDDVDIRIRLKQAARFQKDARQSARSIDEIGDQARGTARELGAMSVAASSARINLGPLSTSARGGALGLGVLAIAARGLVPHLVGAGEAVATMAGGTGAAGGVGLLALAQGAGVAKLGLSGLSEALGGNEEAIRSLSPEMRDLFDLLRDSGDQLQESAQAGLLPGLTSGGQKAARNMKVLNRLVGDTAHVLGGLADDAGEMAGSAPWGRDVGRLGAHNVRIIDSLGGATLNLADATRHVLVEAGPLAEWLAASIRDGSVAAEVWAENARASGDMARFFREARQDLTLLASIGGAGGRGIINLFGAGDVDGTRTLASLDRIIHRFEAWTASPAVQEDLGDALVAEIPDAITAAMDAAARHLPGAGALAGKTFVEAFMNASPEAKALFALLGFGKLGGFKLAGKALSGAIGFGGRGASPANPLYVINVGDALTPGGWLSKLLKTGATAGGALLVEKTVNDEARKRNVIPKKDPPTVAPFDPNKPIWENAADVLGSLFSDRRGSSAARSGPGNPRPLNPPAPFGPIILRVDGREIARADRRANKHRRARTGRGG
jgi:hypothetical protein